MERGNSVILRYLSEPRSILVGLAVFNLTITWMMELERHTCTLGPYSTGGSYFIEAAVPLISSLFLSMNRRWANAVALLVSGYLLGCFVRFFLLDNGLGEVLTDWSHTDAAHLSRQVVFALIMFGYSAISLTRNFLPRKICIDTTS